MPTRLYLEILLMSWIQELTKPNIFLAQFEKLEKNLSQMQKNTIEEYVDLTFYDYYQDKKSLSNKIKKLLKSNQYYFSPVTAKTINLKGKARVVYPSSTQDRIVQMAMNQVLIDNLSAMISDRVYSYIPGRSTHQLADSFLAYIKKHKKPQLDLFVLRTDISDYTDSIPCGDNARIWKILRAKIESVTPKNHIPKYWWQLIKSALRPIIASEDTGYYQKTQGLSMGSPLLALASVLYLDDIDRAIGGIAESFYARFGDDILFAHSDPKIVNNAQKDLEEKLKALGLTASREKTKRLYFTNCARPWINDEFYGAEYIEYVGYRFEGSGCTTLKLESMQQIRQTLMFRINLTLNELLEKNIEHKATVVCKALNNALNSRHPMFETLLTNLYLQNKSKRQSQLLDQWLLQAAAQSITGIRGIQAYQKLHPTILRQKYGLKSIEYWKNQRFCSNKSADKPSKLKAAHADN